MNYLAPVSQRQSRGDRAQKQARGLPTQPVNLTTHYLLDSSQANRRASQSPNVTEGSWQEAVAWDSFLRCSYIVKSRTEHF